MSNRIDEWSLQKQLGLDGKTLEIRCQNQQRSIQDLLSKLSNAMAMADSRQHDIERLETMLEQLRANREQDAGEARERERVLLLPSCVRVCGRNVITEYNHQFGLTCFEFCSPKSVELIF